MSIYDYEMVNIDGENVKLSDYRDKVVVIVNTASKCGLTPQYEGLQELYDTYNELGLEILGFPSNEFAGQEPGGEDEVKSFCSLNYGIDFPMFSKTVVRGSGVHPLFKELSENLPFQGFDELNPGARMLQEHIQKNEPEIWEGNGIKWNFNKFLIDRQGNLVKRFEPYVIPKKMVKDIEALLSI